MPLLGHPLLLPPPRNADQYILLLPTSCPPTWTPMITEAVSLSMDFPTQSTRPGPGWAGSGRGLLAGDVQPSLEAVWSPEEARNVLWGLLTPRGGRGEPQPGQVGPQLGLGHWWSCVWENCSHLRGIQVSPSALPAASGALDVLWVPQNPNSGRGCSLVAGSGGETQLMGSQWL